MDHTDQGSALILCSSPEHLTVLSQRQISASLPDAVNTFMQRN